MTDGRRVVSRKLHTMARYALGRRARVRSAVCLLLVTSLLAPSEAGARRPGFTERVSVRSDGSDPGTDSGTWLSSHVSKDGRYVVFETEESLVPEDLGTGVDIYIRDRKRQSTKIVSVGSDGTQGGLPSIAGSWTPSMTPDGRYVVFYTLNPLVPGDTNLAADIYVRDVKLGSTERASVDSRGNQTLMPIDDHNSDWPSISDNGRYVAFTSDASDLVEDDTNEATDTFVHDRRTGETIRASVANDGRQVEGTNSESNISGNGRYVMFLSSARDIGTGYGDAPDYTMGGTLAGLWIRDLKQKTTEFVIPGGIPDSEGRVISSDGRFVTFNSFWPHYVPNDTNPAPLWGVDSFVFDRKTKRVERVSVTSFGEEADNSSTVPKISGNGRYVSFRSQADNLFDGDTSPEAWPQTDSDAFVHDRFTGTTELVSIDPQGGQTPACPGLDSIRQAAFDPAVSWDGRFVSFVSCSDGLGQGDANQSTDVFVRDRGPILGIGSLDGTGRGTPIIQGWRSFSRIGAGVIEDSHSDVVPEATGRGAEILWATFAYRPQYADLFAKIDIDRMPGPRGGIDGHPGAGDPSILYGVKVLAGGRRYEVRISKHEVSERGDPVFGLFRCDRDVPSPAEVMHPIMTVDTSEVSCREIARLRGGYGTVGESIVTAIPLSDLDLDEKITIDRIEVYSAIGTYRGGANQILDRLQPNRHL